MLVQKDERSFKNNIEAEALKEKKEREEEAKPKPMPTEAARSHGNVSSCFCQSGTSADAVGSQEPSRGAKIDEQLQLEEEAELAKKDAAKKN